MDNQKDQNPCCPRDNEGNIVNISSCCDKNEAEKDSRYLILEKEDKCKTCCFDVFISRCWLTHNKDWNPEGGLILMG